MRLHPFWHLQCTCSSSPGTRLHTAVSREQLAQGCITAELSCSVF